MQAGQIDHRYWAFTFNEEKLEEIVETLSQMIWMTYIVESQESTYFL